MDCQRRKRSAAGRAGAACIECNRRCRREAVEGLPGDRDTVRSRSPLPEGSARSRADARRTARGVAARRRQRASRLDRRREFLEESEVSASVSHAGRGGSHAQRRRNVTRSAANDRHDEAMPRCPILRGGHRTGHRRNRAATWPSALRRREQGRRGRGSATRARSSRVRSGKSRRRRREMIVAAFVSPSKPASGPRDVVGDDQSTAFVARSCSRPRATGSPLSAAKPISTGRGARPRRCPSSARMSRVGTRRSSRGHRRASRSCRPVPLGGRVVGDRRGHHDHVGIAGDGLHRVVHFGGTAHPDHLDAGRRIQPPARRRARPARRARGLGGRAYPSAHSIDCRYTGRRRCPRRSARR